MSPATCHHPRCPSSPRRQNQVPLKEFDLGARDACDPRKGFFRQPGIYKPPAISLAGFMAEWYGYGSIPINTIFRGMNIHFPAILMFTRGTRFWHTAILQSNARNYWLASHYLSSRFGTRNGWIWRVSSNILAKALVQRPHGEQRPQGHGQKKARTHTLDSSNKRSWVHFDDLQNWFLKTTHGSSRFYVYPWGSNMVQQIVNCLWHAALQSRVTSLWSCHPFQG